jgi:hypothetical protein
MTAYTSNFEIPYPQSTDDVQLWTKFQALAEKVDELLSLPDDVAAFVANVITTITATSFATLPSPGPVSVSMTNPSSDFDLLCDVSFSAWMNNGTSSNVQVGVAGSGGMSWAANGFGSGGPIANSDNLIVGGGATVQQCGNFPVQIPAGAAAVTFTMHALRSGGTTTTLPSVNYPTLRVKPRRFVVP